MKTHLKDNPEFARIVERQMRNWEISHQTSAAPPRRKERAVQDFIALSRAVGLPGEKIAAVLAARLNWPMFDKEILHVMAGNDEYRRRLYEHMDERDLGWLESILSSFDSDRTVLDDYFHRLRSTILMLARKSSAIFLGRAADLILPASAGLRVRLQASRKFCVSAFAHEHGLSEKEAAERLEATEHDRAQFIRHHFNVDAASPERHDLILNMERLSVPEAVDIILAASSARRHAALES